MQHIVYQIAGELSPLVYIGYHVNDGVNTLAHFAAGANRSGDRKDAEFFEMQGGSPDQLTVTILSKEDNELDAFNKRNEFRATMQSSFTGPSRFPPGVYERAQKQDGDVASQPFDTWQKRQMKTALLAYQAGLWTFTQVKSLTDRWSRAVVTDDLKTLNPDAFASKYEL